MLRISKLLKASAFCLVLTMLITFGKSVVNHTDFPFVAMINVCASLIMFSTVLVIIGVLCHFAARSNPKPALDQIIVNNGSRRFLLAVGAIFWLVILSLFSLIGAAIMCVPVFRFVKGEWNRPNESSTADSSSPHCLGP